MPIRPEQVIVESIENAFRNSRAQALMLGGIAGSGGGTGGPPGGFVGQLPQKKVTYDLSEIASSGTPASGTSLLDNLNHIRYRIETLETEPNGHTIEDSVTSYTTRTNLRFLGGVVVADNAGNDSTDVTISGGGHTIKDQYTTYTQRTYLKFLGGVLLTDNAAEDTTEVSVSGVSGSAEPSLIASGVYEDLSSLANGATTHFDTSHTTYSGTLELYFNGLKQEPAIHYTEDGDGGGFTTLFTPASGDTILINYNTLVEASIIGNGGGAGHTIKDADSTYAQRSGLQFVGSGVIVSDDSINNNTIITIAGGGGTGSSTLGSDVIVNGGFDTASGWTTDPGWSISGGVAVASGAGGVWLYQTVMPMQMGRTYRVTYTVTVSAGDVVFGFGNSLYSTPRSTNGTYTEDLYCNGSDFLFVSWSSAFTGTIDNVSAREVIPYIGNGRELIDEVFPSGVSSVAFDNLPTNYNKLILEYSVRGTQTGSTTCHLKYKFNDNGTYTNYHFTQTRASQSHYPNPVVDYDSNNYLIYDAVAAGDEGTGDFTDGVTEIINYGLDGTHKKAITRAVNYESTTYYSTEISSVSRWEYTDPVISLDVLLSAGGNYETGSVIRLYGEK